MFYVAELSKCAIVADSRGCRVWYVNEEQAKHKAMALQLNNDNMQFAVVPVANTGNAALSTVCVSHTHPLHIVTM